MRFQTLFPRLAATALVVNLAIGYSIYSGEAKDSREEEAFEKTAVLMQVLSLIRQDYVEPDKIKYDDLLYGAAQGMVSTLDPFSEFLPPEGSKDMREMTEGKFGGVGVEVSVRDGALTVITPMDDSPASRAGILAGDQFRKIGDVSIDSLPSMGEALKKMRGDPGTTVDLTLYRPSSEKTYSVRLERAIIKASPVRDAQVLADGIGYLRLTEFSDETVPGMEKALKKLRADKVKAVILDLRNNPGGTVDSAIAVCGMFLPKGKLVVTTEGRRPSQRQVYTTVGTPILDSTVPVAILLNGGSASAAEIVSGCLKDWKRAVLIGEKSFGKGSVQSLLPLSDGSALRLTTAHYYTPGHYIIHERGIEPDIEVAITEDDLKKAQAAFKEDPSQRVRPDLDPQLRRALETMVTYTTLRQAQENNFATPAAPETTAVAPVAP